MKKILVTASAALVAAVAFAASPASAGSFSIHVGGGHWGHGHGHWGHSHGHWGHGYGVVVVKPKSPWKAHVHWCSAKYVSYDPQTNLFVTKKGFLKQCNSPYI